MDAIAQYDKPSIVPGSTKTLVGRRLSLVELLAVAFRGGSTAKRKCKRCKVRLIEVPTGR